MPYPSFSLGPYSNRDFLRRVPSRPSSPAAFAPNVGAPAAGSALNPTPRPGSYDPSYGGVPGELTPPDVFGNLASVYPNLGASNSALSSDVLSQLKGELSPETIAGIEDDAARFGISSGVGPDILNRRKVRSLGLTREGVQNQGIGNFLNSLGAVSKTQNISPELWTEIANRNATFNAAPVPEAAAYGLESTFNRNAQQFGGARGGGSVTYSGMGAPTRPRAPLAEPNFYWNGPTHGTRGDMPGGTLFGSTSARQLTGGGGYQSPQDLWDFGGDQYDPLNPDSMGNNIDYGGDWQFGVEAQPRFGQNQYDPLADYSGLDESLIDYGASD